MTKSLPKIASDTLQKIRLAEMAQAQKRTEDVDGTELIVYPRVYKPGTDTRLLIKNVSIKPGGTALDLCTGTGAIAFKLAALGASSVLGVDINQTAVDNANANKQKLNLNNVTFQLGNMFESITGRFDVITMNPPYTNAKPSNDFDMCFYDENHSSVRDFISQVKDHLKPGGHVLMSWSNISDTTLIPKLAKKAGLSFELKDSALGRNKYEFYCYELQVQ